MAMTVSRYHYIIFVTCLLPRTLLLLYTRTVILLMTCLLVFKEGLFYDVNTYPNYTNRMNVIWN